MVSSGICIIVAHTTFDFCQNRFCKKTQKQKPKQNKPTNQPMKNFKFWEKGTGKTVNILLTSFFVELSNSAHICAHICQ